MSQIFFIPQLADASHSDEGNHRCICEFNLEFSGEGPNFEPATVNGPSDIRGRLDEEACEAILDFVALKQRETGRGTELLRTSTQLYEPLMGGETRVLELHPAAFDDPFQANLQIVSIDFTHKRRVIRAHPDTKGELWTRQTNHGISLITKKAIWYTALSYTWGAPVFDQTVGLDVGLVRITSGLACALRHLRSSEHSIYLWIDQICINQQDVKEKEAQIPLMGLIYSHATNTVIWLGDDENSDPHLAFETMQNVHWRVQLSDQTISPEDFKHLHLPPAMDRSWWAIRQLFRRPWFTRTWTIQEAYLSKQLFVKCGTAVRYWDDIAAWCYTLEHSGLLKWLTSNDALDRKYSKGAVVNKWLVSGGATINVLQAERLHFNSHPDNEGSLLSVLAITRYAVATEPKDKVYGVLGITKSSILPDYSPKITPRDVYHKACLTEISNPYRVLLLLSCVDHDIPLQPSWIPDWSAPRVTEALGFSTKAWGLYSAGGRLPNLQNSKNKVTLSEDKSRITLRGKIFDQVATLGAVSIDPILHIDDPSVENNRWAIYVDLASNSNPDGTYPAPDTSVYNAFWQTLVAGRDGSGTASPSPEHSEVFSLVLDSTTGSMPSLPGQTYSARREKGYFTLKSLRVRRPAKVLEDLQIALRAALNMRRFAVTRKGYFALVPRGTRVGDEIVVFEKGCVPFVIRRTKASENVSSVYELLGESYVHGIMRGEAMEMQGMPLGDVTLV